MVASRSDKEVTIRAPGGDRNEFAKKLEIKVDLTRPDDAVRAMLDFGNRCITQANDQAQFVKTGGGQEKVQIAGKTYACDWITVRGGVEEGDIDIKLWFCREVPLLGLVKMEAKANTTDVPFRKVTLEFVDAGDQAAADALADAIRKEVHAFGQATWKAVSIDVPEGSKRPSAEELMKIKVTFTETEMKVVGDGKNARKQFFWIDPSKTPRHIDMMYMPPPGTIRPPLFTKGIYSLEGDTLKICLSEMNKPRPTEFKASKEAGTQVSVFKRDKP
jgi:uncharacterized protein (TIGR03067 family)